MMKRLEPTGLAGLLSPSTLGFAPMDHSPPATPTVVINEIDAPALPSAAAAELIAAVTPRLLDGGAEFRHVRANSSLAKTAGLLDFLIAAEEQPHRPEDVFGRLRWGGQFVYLSRDATTMTGLPQRFVERGFEPVRGPASLRTGWGIPLLSPKAHYFIARKTYLVRPREFSDRFTYQVELERRPDLHPGGPVNTGADEWVVRKEVPTFERVLARLKFKAPDLADSLLEKRAKKFVQQIFPLFLTRETAMLRVIERDCPREYLHHFPRVLHMEKDSKGYVQKLWTTWLRNGGRPLSQLEFAKQSAQLLHVLHERVGIIHLDLRMDNMVITDNGVGFVDFGSAVRVNENIHGNAVLSTLFGELMRTSQIQRMMDRMSTSGSLTSSIIRDAYQRVDKAVDLFYLAVQIGQPIANPDLRELIQYDKFSPEAIELSKLTHAVLKPADPKHPRYRTARDVLDAILRIEAELKTGRMAQAASADAEPSKPKVYIWK